MTAVKIPARDIIVEVSDGEVSPTWLAVGGETAAMFNPGEKEETADITTFDSDGEYDEVKMQRGAIMKLEGLLIKDDTTGAADAGQSRCLALAAGVAYASRGSIRFRHPMDTLWKVWTATASAGEQGGETNDMTTFSCTFTKCGPGSTASVV